MVSALWKAAGEGDLTKIKELLKDASSVDIEIKDHTGVTPLIQAVKMGHLEVVKELLAHGADPGNASSQGRPETYTQDPAIIEYLSAALPKSLANESASLPASVNPYESNENYASNPPAPVPSPYDPRAYYYMPPPTQEMMYAQYGYMTPDAIPQMQAYYPPPPPQQQQPRSGERSEGNGTPNLPPADVARNIPCRYFPMCKYGPACLFAHPQPSYFNGPPPPAPHYPAFDPHAPPPSFAPAYYPPPQSFQQPTPPPQQPLPNGTSLNPAPQPASTPSPLALPFTPSAPPPPPAPYAMPLYPPGPPPHPSQHTVSVSPTTPFPPSSMVQGQPPFTPVSPTHHRNGSTASYQQHMPQQQPGTATGFENGHPAKPSTGFTDEGAPQPREGGYRRGSFRRQSFGGRKPPCLFFPTGKCRNGDQCRFPHIRPEDDPEAFGPQGFPPQSFPSRYPRHRGSHFGAISEKRDFPQRRESSHSPSHHGNGVNGHTNGVNGHANGNGKVSPTSDHSPHFPPRGGYHANGNGRSDKGGRNGVVPPTKQRVPNAEDFPSLSGSSTPTATTNGFHQGPTAAQVLKGGAPAKDVLKGATNKLEETLAKISLEDQEPELPPPTFATIGAPTPKLQIAAA